MAQNEFEHQEEDTVVPVPIQAFLWSQTCPFIRPKLGKLHEATCVEIREACKSLERVLVQNIQFGLSPSLTESLAKISRWHMIQTSFPHVMHCTAQLLTNRKQSGIQSGLGAAETKLLYTLHWILLDCAEECADSDYEKRIQHSNPFHFLFPVSSITLFVYLFTPLCHQLRTTDFNNFRLENGFRVWPALWNYKTPDPICFTTPVKPKQALNPFFVRKNKNVVGDVFVGASPAAGSQEKSTPEDVPGPLAGTSTPPPTPEHARTEFTSNLGFQEELEKLALPVGGQFPETIPEESSSNDEEHVMIFRLGSIPESEGLKEGTLFKMSVRQSSNDSSKASPSDQSKERKGSVDLRVRTDASPRNSIGRSSGIFSPAQLNKVGKPYAKPNTANTVNPRFEEIVAIKEALSREKESDQVRPRSNSLPAPKSRQILDEPGGSSTDKHFDFDLAKVKLKPELSMKMPRASPSSQFSSYSACSSPVAERRATSRRGSEKISKKKLIMSDLKAFVEMKLLSKSDKMLDKAGTEKPESMDSNDIDASPRPQSVLGKSHEAENKHSIDADDAFGEQSNLFKGKSMPSLSNLLVDELAANTRYVGVPKLNCERKMEKANLPYPIITVTEHTPIPTPSPDRMQRTSSVESQLSTFIHQLRSVRRLRRRTLVRSRSDSEIKYAVYPAAEAPGTTQYIKPDGEFNVKVVFKALHQICSRENIVKSVRVCQTVLSLVNLLFNEVDKDDDFVLILDIVTKIINCMGCTHGCGDAQRCTTSDAVRSNSQSLLLRLSQKNSKQFATFYRNMITQQSIPTIIDFFHSLCSFCLDPTTLLSPVTINPKIRDFYSSYVNGLENNQNKVECHIFKAIFKKLVSRLAAVSKELRSSENTALYCDVRQFITYVYENDGNTFRKVALSALLDSMDRPNKKDDNARQTQTTRVVRRMQQSEESTNYYVVDETSAQFYDRGPSSGNNNKKGFFKKKSSSSTCASVGDTDNTGESPSGTLKKHATLTPKSSELDLVHNTKRGGVPKRESRLVNWLTRSGGKDNKSFDVDLDDSGTTSSGGGESKRTVRQATIVQKAKRRVEERLRKIKRKRDSTNEEYSASGGISRKGSLENIVNENVIGESNEFVVLKERRLVNPTIVKDGLLRFGFLLEITLPGSLPDAHLMAALMDLPNTVVVSRAATLIECCFLVHACNRGHWPVWMKLPLFRPSCAGIPSTKATGSRARSHGLQKIAGKMFHQWGEALHTRLEEFIRTNKAKLSEIDFTDEAKQRELAQREEEEDFLDEASIGDNMECHLALQIVACMLLYEITAFLRETYQALPRGGQAPKTGVEKDQKAQTANTSNRRWSYGLSSMGQSQASHSLQSITDPHAPPASGERKISFVLQDNESNESAEKPHMEPTSDGLQSKKARPLLLRRGTPAGNSFRRRSIKLQRGKKDQDSESIKRSDSITSGRRKVSSISDDTSEQNSGDESPGVLSNEDQAHEDDFLYMPWLNTVIEWLGTMHFKCPHQTFCHPMCPRRLMRGVSRLLKGVRKIYGEEFGLSTLSPTGAGGTAAEVPQRKEGKNKLDEPAIVKYIKHQVQGGFHSMFSLLIKAASVLNEDQFVAVIPITWDLLLEPNIHTTTCAAALFILAGVKAPEQVKNLLQSELEHKNPETRVNALLRFQTLWKYRHQVWPRMEENSTFKAPPPGIEFTLPSPRIGVECIPVVDSPWMPQTKAKVEEVTLNQDSHMTRRYLVTATKTRKTQRAELVKMALQAQEDKRRVEREQFLITTVPITYQASYEPCLHHVVGDDEADDDLQPQGGQQSSAQAQGPQLQQQGQAAPGPNDSVTVTTGMLTSKSIHNRGMVLFPSSLCSAALFIIQLLDDPAVTADGCAVYEIAYQVLWNCLVEDCSLFLRYVFDKLTRGKHELMFKVLRHLILFVPRLPQQAAFSLYNHIIGFIMFHTRSPQDTSPEMIGSSLSTLWMVVHSVQGIMFKDLKQILRKEQCDASILLTANVPAAKKIIVHGPLGPEAGGIPTQFPLQEDTQFIQILREAHDFFSIDEDQHKEYFLVDHKTHQIHNPSSYVRDFYFFSRAQHPQLSLVHMAPDHAYNAQQRQSFILKFLEMGKVTLTWAILKNVDQVMQRVVFLHDELMKLPAFPRKALESELEISKGGMMGRELLGLDVLHKFMWTKLITRMFEAMSGNFAYSGDIHLFINVLSGSLLVHSEDASVIRYVTAAFINAAQQFKNIFSTNGYLLVMPPLLLTYCNHQSNPLVTGAVEFACKEFYLLHRKPFILQMFGALAALLDTDEEAQYGDPTRVPSKCLFRLLLSLETPTPDPLHITELIHGSQPLRPLDFCYHDDSDEITVLDCISMCVCAVAYASDSLRGQQMLTILEAVLPPYVIHIQTNKTEGKSERDILNHIAVAMRTLVNNCEPLAKNYSGPQMSSPTDMRSSSQRNYSKGGGMTPGYEFADDDSHSKYMSDHSRNKNAAYDRDVQDSEMIRDEFRRPRDTLLCLVSDFYSKSSARLIELAKKGGADAKPVELLDTRSHVRLSEVAMSLLKVSPYDPATMACRGLQRYLNELSRVLYEIPDYVVSDLCIELNVAGPWSHESSRPALTAFLRRLDKTFLKICKKPSIRRHADWEAAAGLLKGIYQALWRHPYIVHMTYLKSLIGTCQSLLMGEGAGNEHLSGSQAALLGKIPPTHFCSTVVRLLALQVRALGETYSLEQACGIQANMTTTQEKSDVLLINLLLPLCLRVGSGRKDVPKMRKSDIVFILNVILNSLSPTFRVKSAVESNSYIGSGGRSGSGIERKIKNTTCQISFLGLRILCVCFDAELGTEWPRTSRIIQELGNKIEGNALWEFLEFVVTVRTSIYPVFRPYIAQKLLKTPMNDNERHFQFVIREKVRSITLGKCKGTLLVEMAHQMKQLKEDLESCQDKISNKKMMNAETNETNRRPRPSLSELFPGLAARFGGSDESKASAANIHRHMNRESSVRVKPSSQDRGEESLEGQQEASSFAEGSIAEDDVPRHRLQRQKFQSRKTFRFRKSRKGNLEFSSVEVDEEKSLDSPLSPSLKEDVAQEEAMDEGERSPDSKQLLPKSSVKFKSNRKKSNSPQNGADEESQNSFSRTSSTCGYRESFGSVERYSLQMLERLEIPPPPDPETERSECRSGRRRRHAKKEDGAEDEDTLI